MAAKDGQLAKQMKRFSLRAMLILVTVVGLFFGYAQWRRRALMREARQLEAEDVDLSIVERWLWPTMSDKAMIAFDRLSHDDFEIRGRKLTTAQAIAHWSEMNKRLKAWGVKHVGFVLRMSDGTELGVNDGESLDAYLDEEEQGLTPF